MKSISRYHQCTYTVAFCSDLTKLCRKSEVPTGVHIDACEEDDVELNRMLEHLGEQVCCAHMEQDFEKVLEEGMQRLLSLFTHPN